MRKLLLFNVICLFITVGSLIAQEEIKYIPNFGQDAIVREWTDTQTVTYTRSADGKNQYFVFSQDGEDSVSIIDIPDEYQIKDMVVYGEHLFYCGTYNDGGYKRAMIGALNIPNSFSYGMHFYTISFDWMTDMESSDSILYTDIYRLSDCVFESDGGHIAMIAEAKICNSLGDRITTTVVTEIFVSATLYDWTFYTYYTDNPSVFFTDVSHSENYHVAVGQYQSDGDPIVKLFGGSSPFTFDPLNNTITKIVDATTTSRVLVDGKPMTDEVAIVNQYADADSVGHTVKILNIGGQVQLIHSLHRTQGSLSTSLGELSDFRFHNEEEIVGIILDMAYPISSTTKQVLCEYSIPSIDEHEAMVSWMTNYKMYSIDDQYNSEFRIAGIYSNRLVHMRKDAMYEAECGHHQRVYFEDNTDSVLIYEVPVNEYQLTTQATASNYNPNLSWKRVVYKCLE